MTRGEAEKELIEEAEKRLVIYDNRYMDAWADIAITERIARREAEARVKKVEAERDRWYNAAQSMADQDSWIAEHEAGLVYDEQHDRYIFKEKP